MKGKTDSISKVLFVVVLTMIIFGVDILHTAKNDVIYKAQHVTLRNFPWPYVAMLAIDSDADHVDLRKFNEIHQFLNTYAETPMGRGLGLDISDSFFLYNGSNITGEIDYNGTPLSNEMTLFQGITPTPSVYAPIILHYIRHGWIDTFHSAGDFSRINQSQTVFHRSLEKYALGWLSKQHIRPILDFTDHGNRSNRANFGSSRPKGFYSYQQGDNPKSPYYIADLLKKEGVKFLWADHYDNQFSYHTMLYHVHLKNGTWIWGFQRFTGTKKVYINKYKQTYALWDNLWNPEALWQEISSKNLHYLIRTGGYTVVATHLEGNANRYPLSSQDIEALVHLAHLQDRGKILVARTSRLLWYNLIQQGVVYSVISAQHQPMTYINVLRIKDSVDGNFIPTWQELRGLNWVVAHPFQATILINGKPIPTNAIIRSKDTIGISWYRKNTVNWTVQLHSAEYKKLYQKMVHHIG